MPGFNDKLGVKWSIEIRNEDGSVEIASGENSLLFNYLQLLKSCLTLSDVTVKDTQNKSRTVGLKGGYNPVMGQINGNMGCNALANDDTYGIVIGNGSVAVSTYDYCLSAPIPNKLPGMSFYNMSIQPPLTTAGTASVTLTRMFVNMTTQPISVKEIGIVCHAYDSAGTIANILIIKDVVPSMTVNINSILTVTYQMYTTL